MGVDGLTTVEVLGEFCQSPFFSEVERATADTVSFIVMNMDEIMAMGSEFTVQVTLMAVATTDLNRM